MYEIDGVVYARSPEYNLEVRLAEAVGDARILVTFSIGETRLFDASPLLAAPAFAPLKDRDVFASPVIDRGVCTWLGGKLDVAPDYMYKMSVPA